MTGQKPSVGRIVLVPADPANNNGGELAAAIITRVWSDTKVNVRVVGDNNEVEWRTSVEHADTLPSSTRQDWDAGRVPMVWAWPPRV